MYKKKQLDLWRREQEGSFAFLGPYKMHVKELIWLAQPQYHGIGRKKLWYEIVKSTSLSVMILLFDLFEFSNLNDALIRVLFPF